MKIQHLLVFAGILIVSLNCPDLHAGVRLPKIISDGAVLQRNTPVTIWGWADEGEVIGVYLDGRKLGETRAKNTRWSLRIAPQKAGGPHKIDIRGTDEVSLSDIYFGDVWLASGQSNMKLPMELVKYTYADEVARVNNPKIRQFTVPLEYDFAVPHQDFTGGGWMAADAEHIGRFSAVAYFFAKSVHASQSVPIGIINSAVDGSMAECWLSEEALRAFPERLNTAVRYRDKAYLKSLEKNDKLARDSWYAKINQGDRGLNTAKKWYAPDLGESDWKTMSVPGYWADTEVGDISGVVWFRKTISLPAEAAGRTARLLLGVIVVADIVYVNGVEVGRTSHHNPLRYYRVGPGILKAGKNTIAVRVTGLAGNGGFVADKPYWLEFDGKKYDLSGSWRYRVGVVVEPVPRTKFVASSKPLGFYNAMVAPLEHTAIKGVIWYQGESNVGHAQEYARMMPALIEDWRRLFKQPDLPFIQVQLANFREVKDKPGESALAELREAQAKTLAVENTAMAVAIDVGEWNDIHPLNKKTVGERLALAARHLVYGEDLVYSGPVFRCMTLGEGEARLYFDHTGSGLTARGGKLQGFAIAVEDGPYQWGEATLENNHVTIKRPDSPGLVRVRYAWADNPDTANLYNREGLPAVPFQSHRLCAPENTALKPKWRE